MSLSANFRTVFNNINSDLSGISAVLETKADATSIPSAVSQLANDSGFATTGYVDDGLATKQNVIDSENKLDYGLLSAVPDPSWGTLTGDLSGQTDLQNALDLKADKIEVYELSGTVEEISGQLEDTEEILVQINEEHIIRDPFYYIAREQSVGPTLRFYMNGNVGNIPIIEYSYDKINWTVVNWNYGSQTRTDILPSPLNTKVFLRSRTGRFSIDSNNYVYLNLSMNSYIQKIELGGNILSLVNGLPIKTSDTDNFTLFTRDSGAEKDLRNLYISSKKLNSHEFEGAFLNNNIKDGIGPHILATELEEDSLKEMFKGSNITELKVYFTSWNNGTTNWLQNVPASGTFYCPSSLDTTTRDASHVPSGWTIVTF